MNREELDKLNEKLAKWVGFRQDWTGIKPAEIEVWLAPGVSKPESPTEYFFSGNNYSLPDFTNSLDACFKWLVPLAIDGLADSDLSTSTEAYYKLFDMWLKEAQDGFVNALALCFAIEKIIEGEKK